MVEPGSSEEFTLALVNAVLLALWPVLPGLLLGYVRQSLAARHVRPEFSLRKSETLELDRAVRLYGEICDRLRIIKNQSERPNGFWRGIFDRGRKVDRGDADELEDLKAHAEVLRETIALLRRRPLQRLRSWAHLISSKSALGRALAAHVVGFVLLLIAFHVPEQRAWADELTTGVRNVLTWYPIDQRFFYANAVAAGFAAAAAPVFYLVRWAGLRREYGCEFCVFKELARSDPGQVIDRLQVDQADPDASRPADSEEVSADQTWFAVFGLSSSAPIEEVKEAYKRLIKQSHPDRVHGMSPAFRKLAEAETKKLNAALRQALISVPPLGAASN